jgi:hypothetical protein
VTLSTVTNFTIPVDLIEKTLAPLREAGSCGFEAFVFWGGRMIATHSFEFVAAYVPEQRTSRTDDGLLVVVKGEALFRVNRAFYQKGLTLGAQVHSHPTDAYHSETDDECAMVTLAGGLSGVVPDFGEGGLDDFGRWAWYRLSDSGKWDEMRDETVLTLR